MMKFKRIIIIASWLTVLATMVIIFYFSAQSAEKSSQTSGGVIEEILGVVLPKEEITEEIIEKYQPPFRKIAHFCIFMLLGFCLINAFQNSFKFKCLLKFILSFFCAALYAIFDEIHQGFIEDRGPAIKDVLIDSSGGIIGILAYIMMIYIINKLKLKREW